MIVNLRRVAVFLAIVLVAVLLLAYSQLRQNMQNQGANAAPAIIAHVNTTYKLGNNMTSSASPSGAVIKASATVVNNTVSSNAPKTNS